MKGSIAIIPARGGSKRIEKKNIRPFKGYPMIRWSIDAAQNCGFFDRIIISTDDEEISEISVSLGAEAPFQRPASLSDDITPMIPVVNHAIDWITSQGDQPQYVCCLHASSPLIRSDDISIAYSLLRAECDIDFVVPVVAYSHPIQRALKITKSKTLQMVESKNADCRSQDLDTTYHDAAQFYFGRTSSWLKASNIFTSKTLPLVLPSYRVQDIDNLEDWNLAEIKFETLALAGKQA